MGAGRVRGYLLKTKASGAGRSAAKSSISRPVPSSPRVTRAGSATTRDLSRLVALPDDALLEIVQRQTFRYFWEGAHPVSGLAFDRRTSRKRVDDTDAITIGGSGFGVMALLVAAER